jgi:hypothetical protein
MNHASSGRATLARNTNGTHQREAKDRRRNRGLTLCVAILAAVLIAVMVAAPQRAKGEELKNEAEAMTLSGSSVLVQSDDSASGGQNVTYFTEGSVSMPFSGELTGVNLRAREKTNCVGNPKLLVLVDGLEKGTIIVTSSTYDNYPLSISGVGAGSHQLRIEYINDRITKKCDRNAYLDYVTRTITDATVTPLQTTIDSGPSATLSSNSVNFVFSSTEPGSTFECKLDDAAYASCSSPQGYTNLPEGAHTFSVRATDAAGNTDATPASRTWTVDTTAPSVGIVTPTGGATDVALTTGATATFSEPVAASTITASSFTLKKQGATTSVGASIGYDEPTKKATLTPNSDLEAGATYTATVQGGPGGVKDLAGNALAQDEVWSFTTAQAVDTTAPDPPVLNSPQENSFDTDGNVTVSGTAEPSSTVEIFDGTTSKGTTQADASGNWSKTLTGVAEGSHTYTAKATDAAGNTSGASNTRTVEVDTRAPSITITSGPASGNTATSASASFGFSSNETGSSFQCSLDGAAYTTCTSPQDYSNLSEGSHTFSVKATDAAGNTGAPVSRTWTVDTTVPTVGIVTPASGATNVAVGTSVEATFSEGMDQSTLNQGTFTLVKQGTTTPVTATVSYDTQAKKAILKPTTALAEGSTYTVTLKGGTSGVKDIAGNPLQTDKTWSFSTTAVMAPSNLTATRVGSGNKQRVDLSWVDNSKIEAKFVIERSTASGFTSNLATYQAPADATSFSNTDVQPNKQYFYRVFAVNPSGTRSAASNVVSVTTGK